MSDPEDLAQRILGSAKYRHLDPAFVTRLATEAAQNQRAGDAEQQARRRLHQAVGAFALRSAAAVVERARAEVASNPVAAPEAWRRAAAAHRSTAERAAHFEELGALVGRWAGRPRSVADLAGGLGPLAVPWLPLAPEVTYLHIDVDVALAAALGRAGPLLGVDLVAQVRDLVEDPPTIRAELGLFLKAAPTLEAERSGSTATVLGRLTCQNLVISLPCRSLGGRRRYHQDPVGMVAGVAEPAGYRVADDTQFGNEHYVLCCPVGGDYQR